MPSMVVISEPPTSLIAVVQERIAAPFWWTVQAPHKTMPQPNFVPVKAATSPKYHNKGISGSPSNVCSFPLTLKRPIYPPINHESWVATAEARRRITLPKHGRCRNDFHILVVLCEMWKRERPTKA